MKKLAVFFLLTVFVLLGAVRVFDRLAAAEKQNCVICSESRRYNLCLLNAETGMIEEIPVYAPDPYAEGERAGSQPEGTFSFVRCLELRGTLVTSSRTCELRAGQTDGRINKKLFCISCLRKVKSKGQYVLLDLHGSNTRAYSLNGDRSYTVRDFFVRASGAQGGELTLTVTGK